MIRVLIFKSMLIRELSLTEGFNHTAEEIKRRMMVVMMMMMKRALCPYLDDADDVNQDDVKHRLAG